MKEPESDNFSANELRCKCKQCKNEQPNKINIEALEKLQELRFILDKPISLSSAYRCKNHSAEIKKPKAGTHNQGIAFDITVPYGAERMEIIAVAVMLGFKGFGFANTFLHIDTREDFMSWTY